MDELVPTRATLLNRLKDLEDHTSWQDFFDIYWRLIFDMAIKSGLRPAEAQDVVQETMMAVAKHIPNFKYDPALGSFKAWLFNLTRWRITDQLRKRGPVMQDREDTATGTQTIERIPDSASDALEVIWNREWETNLLNAALDKVKRRVDPGKYQVFDFYVNKAWPPEKVAKTFGISVGQVYLAKHRVAELVREEIDRIQREVT